MNQTAQGQAVGSYAPVNGLNMYYEVLPGTTHVGMLDRADWLLAMVSAFLDAPMPERKFP